MTIPEIEDKVRKIAFTPAFGRIPEFDARNADWHISYRQTIGSAPPIPSAINWHCAKVLNQRATPRCTAFSLTTELIAEPVPITLRGEKFATTLHAKCGDSSGASILSCVKELTREGYYSGYYWGKTVNDLLRGLAIGPAIIGIDWFESMNTPNKFGLLPEPSGKWLGLHCLVVRGHTSTNLFLAQNTWGNWWGKGGSCFLSFATLAHLLSRPYSEICFPVGRSKP